jgi:esterase/lipase superfamily enzyme
MQQIVIPLAHCRKGVPFLVICGLFMAGCATPSSNPANQASAKGGAQLHAVKLYYATDRRWSGSVEQPKWYGPEWNGGEKLDYGTCWVTIPPEHVAGNVEKPSVLQFEIQEDSLKHVVVLKPVRMESASFFSTLGEGMKKAEDKEAIVYVHGFNNTFDEAASRFAVLAYDMGFRGIPILYSWPSHGGGSLSGVRNYLHDEEMVTRTDQSLATFLEEVSRAARAAGARRVSVIAHSMGSRALVKALDRLAERNGNGIVLDEAVMAAPDVMREGFDTLEWPGVRQVARRTTIYASASDRALIASKTVHNNGRLGDGGDGLYTLDNLDTVDATGVDFSTLGLMHSYLGAKPVLDDLRLLLGDGLPPGQRRLLGRPAINPRYWVLPSGG